jgi:hypothetical protein
MVGRWWDGDSKAHERLVLVLGQAMLRGLCDRRGRQLLGRLERTLLPVVENGRWSEMVTAVDLEFLRLDHRGPECDGM